MMPMYDKIIDMPFQHAVFEADFDIKANQLRDFSLANTKKYFIIKFSLQF